MYPSVTVTVDNTFLVKVSTLYFKVKSSRNCLIVNVNKTPNLCD